MFRNSMLIFKNNLYSYTSFPNLLIPLSDQNARKLSDLCKHLNISVSKAKFLCLKNPTITKLSSAKIENIVNTIEELGFEKEVLIQQPALFGILPVTLKNRYKVLKECGIVNILPNNLLCYLPLVKQKTIKELKNIGTIQPYLNIENRLASSMTQWPTSLTSMISYNIDDTTLFSLRLKIIQRYLELTLDLTKEEFNRGIKTYPTIKHRPLGAINMTLKLLAEIMMPKQKIKSNLYLIHTDPENLEQIVNLRLIGGIDAKEVLRLHPKIAMKNYTSILEISEILQNFNICNEAQVRCLEIYTLGPETVKERLQNAQIIPEFKVLFNHPRFLKMIYYNTTVLKRINTLYRKNKKCLSLHILSGSTDDYETFEKAPGDRMGKGKDLIFCISEALGKEYSTKDVRNIIKRHPFWINIPLVQVKYVFEKLSTEFTSKEIYENCSILLYPWNKVKVLLQTFHNNSVRSSLQDSVNLEKLSKSQKLSLVVYLLEKNHYFSGNGVWTEDKNKSDVISPCK